jgi:hypothetical protein
MRTWPSLTCHSFACSSHHWEIMADMLELYGRHLDSGDNEDLQEEGVDYEQEYAEIARSMSATVLPPVSSSRGSSSRARSGGTTSTDGLCDNDADEQMSNAIEDQLFERGQCSHV